MPQQIRHLPWRQRLDQAVRLLDAVDEVGGECVPIRYNCDNTEKPSKLKGWRAFVCSFSIHFGGAKSAEKGVPKNKMLYMRQHF